MKHIAAILLLWLIAIATTFMTVTDPGMRTRLAPVWAVCMIGSVVTVRAAVRRPS